MKKTLLTVCLALGALCLCCFAAGAEAKTAMELLRDPNGRVIVVSDAGNHAEEPENSFEAVDKAFLDGADGVIVSLQKTSDGALVLFADETVDRMFGMLEEDEVGARVDSLTLDHLRELPLYSGEGGHYAHLTERCIATLDEILDLMAEHFKDRLLFIRHPDAHFQAIADAVRNKKMTGNVVFLMDDVKAPAAGQLHETNEDLCMIPYYRGNIIMSALSAVKKASFGYYPAAHLASGVSYGVVFGETVQGKARALGVRTMADVTDHRMTGKLRQDTRAWWDDLIGRGFSIIVTDDAAGLKKYIADCDGARKVLKDDALLYIDAYSLPDFNSDRFIDYKHDYNNAVTAAREALDCGFSSFNQLQQADADLREAYFAINDDYDALEAGSAGKTVSAGRVVAAVLGVAGVIALELFIYKKKAPKKKGAAKK